MNTKIAIIGAGPIGLEAALAARRRGADVVVFERGEAGHSVRKWGHVRMFSPFGMNSSEAGRELVSRTGRTVPRGFERVSGRRYLEEYLQPLAEATDVLSGVEVVGLHRDEVGGEQGFPPFRVVSRGAQGERCDRVDCVFDCTGTFDTPVRLDSRFRVAGIERCADRIDYGVPDVSRAHRDQFAGRRVLVVGAGYSGATVVRDLCAIRLNRPDTRVLWISRRGLAEPVPPVPRDPIEAREALVRHVNELARLGEVDFRPAHVLLGLERLSDHMRVVLGNAGRRAVVEIDRIVAAIGFVPCEKVSRGLRLDLCPESGANRGIADHIAKTPEDRRTLPQQFERRALLHPEPGYYRLGSKSYGGLPGFLIATGLHQIDLVLDTVFGGV